MEGDRVSGAPVVSGATSRRLSERQLVDYREYKGDVLRWLAEMGKNPDKGEGFRSQPSSS